MGGIKVAIVGAGPAGCTLVRLLHRSGINVTVFEGENSPDYRAQGGSLDLHTTTGLAALKEAGLFDEFQKHARYDGQYMAIVDKGLKYHMVRDAKGAYTKIEERPEIDRLKLREMLAYSLPEGMIKWGHHLKRIEDNILIFEHTTASGFDLIVGADGAWSKVRKHLDPDLLPKFAGVAMHELEIPDAENAAPNVHKLVNRGSVFACSDGHRLSVQQMGDGSLGVGATWVTDSPDWMSPEKCSYDASNLAETRKYLLEKEFHDWCPELREVLEKTAGKCRSRSLFYLPVAAKWPHKPGFTLIGDAAHLMTPHAGEGVNQAMEDAMHLARVIAEADKGEKDLDKAIIAFEENMMARVSKTQQLSHDLTQDWMFTPGAPKACMAKIMSRHVRHKVPVVLQPLGVAMVHSYFFCRSFLG